jgi:hypothetical protein
MSREDASRETWKGQLTRSLLGVTGVRSEEVNLRYLNEEKSRKAQGIKLVVIKCIVRHHLLRFVRPSETGGSAGSHAVRNGGNRACATTARRSGNEKKVIGQLEERIKYCIQTHDIVQT